MTGAPPARTSQAPRGRFPVAAAFVAIGLALAGCSAARTTGTTVPGSTLTIYTRAAPGDAEAADVAAAESLALRETGGQIGRYRVLLKVLGGSSISADARSAIADTSAIAYLGELRPHESADSIGITNGIGILQVSPFDTAVELTQATAAVPGTPNRYYENLSSNGRTFGRVVPAADREAEVQVSLMRRQRVSRALVADDGTAYGRSIGLAVRAAAASAGLPVSGESGDALRHGPLRLAGADGLFLGASTGSAGAAARAVNAAVAKQPRTQVFVPSALETPAFASALSPAAASLTIATSPGFSESDLTPDGRRFREAFTSAYGHPPPAAAVFGYAAMQAVAGAIRRAGAVASSRAAVVRAFLHTSNFPSVLGLIDVNPSTGDLRSPAPFTVSRVRGGRFQVAEGMQGR